MTQLIYKVYSMNNILLLIPAGSEGQARKQSAKELTAELETVKVSAGRSFFVFFLACTAEEEPTSDFSPRVIPGLFGEPQFQSDGNITAAGVRFSVSEPG